MSDDTELLGEADLKNWAAMAKKKILTFDPRFRRQQTHCPRCKRKLDVATRSDGNVVSYIRFCYPCDTLEDDA